ncbi:addiction module antitoxin [Pandoraea capi]|uniref:Addiction module antitoxin n=1 Tax=Pandoraea capi TaxID=2508286 RepID=A0ABY6W0L9_9BURK|nr:addiction module antitoxin [Pandoraea capi]
MISAELGQTLESYVAERVEKGQYGSKSEVLREGVRLVQDRKTQFAAPGAVIEKSIADAEAGRGQPAADVFDRLEKKYQAVRVPGCTARRAVRPPSPRLRQRSNLLSCGRIDVVHILHSARNYAVILFP